MTQAVDVRHDPAIASDVAAFLLEYGVTDSVGADRMLGCPHEEGIDYPMGRTCPRCPFWAGIDRFTHEPVVVPVPTMSPVEILASLAEDAPDPPEEALASADGHRDALVEPLLAALDRGMANPAGASLEDVNLFAHALYLLAKWREPRAFPAVVRWLSLPDHQPFAIAGDIVTEDGARILAAVCDGDLAPIKALILNRDADGYGRGTGVSALALLAAWAEVPHEPIVEYIRHCPPGSPLPGYQSTRTARDSWMGTSRVSRGRSRSRAAAQINASNGSRVKRSSSASNTWMAVSSCVWYAGLLNRSAKNSRTGRCRLIFTARASRLISQMTATGT